MARKDKFTVDYFPHNVKHGKSMFIIENRFGNDGYAFWFKMLELLGSSDHHYIDCRDDETFEYLLAYAKVSQELANEILGTLAKLKKIHPGFWGNKVIWSSLFVENIDDVYKRRENNRLGYIDLCEHLSIKCEQKYTASGDDVNGNQQTKLKKTKPKEISVVENDVESENKEINIPFLNFWDMYDKKIGDKKKCEKKWNSLNDEQRAKIYSTLPSWKRQFKDKQFQPYPKTYLNQERWNDEIQIAGRLSSEDNSKPRTQAEVKAYFEKHGKYPGQ